MNPDIDPSEIFEGVRRVRAIRKSGMFTSPNARHPLFQSAFTELVIYVRDLVAKAEKAGTRISFADAVDVTPDCCDVSDLIRIVRDAVCHIDSPKRTIAGTAVRGSFNVFFRAGVGVTLGNVTVGSAFDDDICFCYGARRLYLNRHLWRAFDEAVAVLSRDPQIADLLSSID